jgi:hypothetical protein
MNSIVLPAFAANVNGRAFHTFALHDVGTPSALWTYHYADGALAGAIARYNTPHGKTVRPWVERGERWSVGAMPAPRPLYHLPELLTRQCAPVLVTEGEKAADTAAQMFPGHVVTTSAGGSQAAARSAWAALAGRDVTIWPDHDAAGAKYAADVARLALSAGAHAVRVVSVPASWPVGFDLADALPDGVTIATLAAMLVDAAPPVPRHISTDAQHHSTAIRAAVRATTLPCGLDKRRLEGAARAALERRAAALAQTGAGGRNAALFGMVAGLGRYIHHGILPFSALETAVLQACAANGLTKENGHLAVLATLRQGLERAKNDPLPILKDRARRAA